MTSSSEAKSVGLSSGRMPLSACWSQETKLPNCLSALLIRWSWQHAICFSGQSFTKLAWVRTSSTEAHQSSSSRRRLARTSTWACTRYDLLAHACVLSLSATYVLTHPRRLRKVNMRGHHKRRLQRTPLNISYFKFLHRAILPKNSILRLSTKHHSSSQTLAPTRTLALTSITNGFSHAQIFSVRERTL